MTTFPQTAQIIQSKLSGPAVGPTARSVTLDSPPTVGNVVVVVICAQAASPWDLADPYGDRPFDNFGNGGIGKYAWGRYYHFDRSGGSPCYGVNFAYAAVSVTGTPFTVTWNKAPAGVDYVMGVYELSAVSPAPTTGYDAFNESGANIVLPGTTINAPITTDTPHSMMLGLAMYDGAATTITPDGNWTQIFESETVPVAINAVYRQVDTAATYSDGWTLGASRNADCVVLAIPVALIHEKAGYGTAGLTALCHRNLPGRGYGYLGSRGGAVCGVPIPRHYNAFDGASVPTDISAVGWGVLSMDATVKHSGSRSLKNHADSIGVGIAQIYWMGDPAFNSEQVPLLPLKKDVPITVKGWFYVSVASGPGETVTVHCNETSLFASGWGVTKNLSVVHTGGETGWRPFTISWRTTAAGTAQATAIGAVTLTADLDGTQVFDLYLDDVSVTEGVYEKTGSGVSNMKGSGPRIGGSHAKTGFGKLSGVASGPRLGGSKVKAGYGVLSGKGLGPDSWSTYFPTMRGLTAVRVGVWDDVAPLWVTFNLLYPATGFLYSSDRVTTGLDSKVGNGHFDVTATGWAAIAGATVTRSTAEHKFGAGSLSVACTATDDGTRNTSGKTLTMGKWYRHGAYVKGTAGEGVKYCLVNNSNSLVGDETILTLDGSWQFVTWDAQALVTEAHHVQFRSTTGAQTFFLDGVAGYQHVEFQVNTALLENSAAVWNGFGYVSDAVAYVYVADSLYVAGSTAQWVVIDNPVPQYPTPKVEIAFASNRNDTTQVWTDVTSDFLGAQIQESGRGGPLDTTAAGTAKVSLRNHHRYYDNVNPASPYAGKVLPGHRIRMTCKYNGLVIPLFDHAIREWVVDWTPGGKGAYVVVDTVDDFESFQTSQFSTPSAVLTTALAGSNNDLVFTYKGGGGNDVSVEYIDPGAADAGSVDTETTVDWSQSEDSDDMGGKWSTSGHSRSKTTTGGTTIRAAAPPPTLEVSGRAIKVTLAYSGAITSTASQVKAAIEADLFANKLVTVTLAPGNSGAGIVTAMAATNLVGGARASENADARMKWVLAQIGVPDSRIDFTQRYGSAAASIIIEDVTADRESGLTHLQECAVSDSGFFYIDRSGVVRYQDRFFRRYRIWDGPTLTFADDPDPGEFLYVGVEPDSGVSDIRNDVTVTGSSQQPTLFPVEVSDAASKAAYGTRTYSVSTLITQQADVQDKAQAIIDTYKQPTENIRSMDLEPARDALGRGIRSAWPTALMLGPSDYLRVRRSPPGGGTITYDVFVEGKSMEIRTGNNGVASWSVNVTTSIISVVGT